MKRFTVLLILFAVISLLVTIPAFAQSQVKIAYLKGLVKVQRQGEDFWTLAKKGMILNDKDKVKAFAAAEAEIALDSTLKNIIKLQQNTQVVIEDSGKQELSMPEGKIFALVESLPSGSSFEVRTPTAVAGVAGSGMSVGTNGSDTTVCCFEDKAYVKGINKDGTPMAEIVIIDNGYKRVIGRFEMPGELLALTSFDRENWQSFRENLREHLDWLRSKRAEGSRGAAAALQEIQRIQERAEDRFFEGKENIYEEREHERRDDWEPPPPPADNEDTHHYKVVR